MDYLVSVSSNDFMMSATAKELAAGDSFISRMKQNLPRQYEYTTIKR
jgi:hypothetical protein